MREENWYTCPPVIQAEADFQSVNLMAELAE